MAQQDIDYVERAARHHPLTYSGEIDPAVLDEWTFRMEQVFESIRCPEDQKLVVATRYLSGRALQWWRTRQADPTRRGEMSWKDFTQRIGDYFYPPHFREAKKEEFRTLAQDDKTSVTDYYYTFMDLMRHGMDLVPTDEAKVRKFVKGLYPLIRADVGYLPITTTLEEAYGQALFAEETSKDVRRVLKIRRVNRSGRDEDGQSGDQGQGPEQLEMYEKGEEGNNSGKGGGLDVGIQCYKCKQWGHRKKECPVTVGSQRDNQFGASSSFLGTGRSIQCYYCWGIGHLQRDCPQFLQDKKQKGKGGPGIPGQRPQNM